MTLCPECNEYPEGTRCAAATCPGKFKVRAPAIADGDGWPFQMLGRLPYRPVDLADWRGGIAQDLAASFHSQGVAHD